MNGYYRRDNKRNTFDYTINYVDLDGNEITDKNSFHVQMQLGKDDFINGIYDRTTKVLRVWDGPLDDKNTVTYKYIRTGDSAN